MAARATARLALRASARASSAARTPSLLPRASPAPALPAAAAPSPHCIATRSLSTASSGEATNGAPPKKNVTASAADRRLAGRRRFYKKVDIAPCNPPAPVKSNKDDDGARSSGVASPISAGVDGTQSATGVATAIGNTDRWSSLLNPHPSNEWHTVTLDGRPLRTPLGLPLTLPSPLLALAVASEWDAQKKYLQPAQMPLMTLCCTAIDQVASDPTPHREEALRYLGNDTSCYLADPTEDRVLHRRQSRAWEGLHDELSSNLLGLPSDVTPTQAVGGSEALLLSRQSRGHRGSGLPHPPLLVEKARRWVEGLDAWTLAAFYSACAESKSFYIGAGLIHDALTAGEATTARAEAAGAEAKAKESAKGGNDGKVRCGKWAAEASRVEEEFNIECWGLVEGGHDYDRLNCSIQMHAASFLARTVASSSRPIPPASDVYQ